MLPITDIFKLSAVKISFVPVSCLMKRKDLCWFLVPISSPIDLSCKRETLFQSYKIEAVRPLKVSAH